MRPTVYAAFAVVITCFVLSGYADVPPGGFKSPEGDARFTAEAGAKPLNNLVFELLNVKSPAFTAHIFKAPRKGWIYIRVPKPKGEDRAAVVDLDDRDVPLKAVGDGLEAMRYVCEGAHSIAIKQGAGRYDQLEVRAIGELFFAAYGDSPHIKETGNYTWDYLKEHCLDSYNSMIGAETLTPDGKSTQEAEIKEWTDQGKRWYTLHPVPDEIRTNRPTQSVEDAIDYWTTRLGMQHPLISGFWADEFGPRQAKYFPMWTEALRKIHADPKYKDRMFYAYCSNRFWPLEDGYKVMYPFMQALMDCGYGMGPEWYLTEGWSRPGREIVKTEDLRAELGPEWEMTSRESFEKAAKGAAENRIVIVGLLSEPSQESSDLFANYNFNVFLDYQMQFIATEPAFFGIRGVQGYLSSYAAEEQVRLFAKLVRHYAIEGHTDRLLKDPYVLHHIENPDFVDGTSGWNLEPAVTLKGQESIAAKTVKGLGALEAKYHAPEGTGDYAIWTQRSAQKPNVISQEVKDLVPGRLYSLHFLTGDYQEFQSGKSVERKHAVSVKIENTEPLPDKCFQAVVGCGYWYGFGPFNRENRYWMNYHQQVFRAKAKTAKLVLSDWATDDSAQGPEGEELIWNFVQLQPYFAE